MKVSDYITLYRLAKNRLRSEEDYKRFQRFQASLLLEYMQQFGIDVRGKVVLDLGSGLGGYSQEIARKGGAAVISLDLIEPIWSPEQGICMLVGNALSIPLRDESVDFVFCASLIEHVSNPSLLLTEIKRVLRSGQYCYLSFPPFYSLRGGHEFSPFHYLGEQCALRLFRLLKRRPPNWVMKIYKPSLSPISFASTYQGWGLFKLTIRKTIRMIRQVGLEIIDVSPRYLPINTARWPILGELLTWHVQFLVRKRD
ncbi:methyltransferase domain-containing protein [Candidatus Hadarchaeum sp.]|uniref:methyltransferase domain-containing protein n=1 Tax=Candidatus Hadarchaeum sp. TaxID=2883567 RepID=UPI00385721F1